MIKRSTKAMEFLKRPPVMGASFVLTIILLSIVISTHSFLVLFSLEGLLIVIGGVLAVAFMSYQTADVKRALDVISQLFDKPEFPNENLQYDMMKIVAWASIIKEKGMRSLETSMRKSGINDPFVKYGLNMVVSSYTPDEVRAMMETASDAAIERESFPITILQAMASHAPAFGMVGTLVGMVAMLCNMNGNVSVMGSSLAVSFLSTLYGVMTARMLYMPAASRLQQEIDKKRFRYHLITEGMVLLVGNKNPMYIQDRLNSFLKPEIRDYFDYFSMTTQRTSAPVSASPPPIQRLRAATA